ncbi:hypothetical protein JCM3770_005892 [Rhodotorula araucariae]
MPKKEENEENICHWLECLTQFDSAEELFNHVCSHHIGRKSAGTLSLECKWTGCRAKASKRDHLTSHCRVHIALKPHVCTICHKAFKRPQDLKKHEKIHTEEHQAQHRVNKNTITISSDSAHAIDPSKAQPGEQQPVSQVTPVPYPFAFPAMAGAFPYMFAQQGQASPAVNPQFGLPGQMSQMDLAYYIAFQQQLNSQAHAAAALPNMQAGLPAAYAMQLGQQAMNAQALQFLPQGAGVYPYGTAPFAFSAAPPARAQYPVSSMPASGGMASATSQAPPPPGMVATPPSSSSPPQPQLYPTLPQALYGQGMHGYGHQQTQPPVVPPQATHPHLQHQPQQIKAEDIPSPAHSARSHKSHYSSSVSPANVPALSPPSSLTPENSFSPSPGPDGSQRAPHGTSAVAGKKRGFEEATGSFLGSLANKRFQDADSVGAQLDSLSSFLLTPELSAHALSPPGVAPNGEDSPASSGGSEYGSGSHVFEREEVDTINQLLLTLNQNFDAELAASAVSLGDVQGSLGLDAHGVAASDQRQHQQQQQRHMAGLPSSSSYPSQNAGSLYPNLAGSHVQRQSAPATYPQLPSSMALYGYSGHPQQQHAHDPQQRLAKSVAAPTIANDYRPTQYHHVGRLQRAASSAAHVMSIEEQVEQELLDADMEVDDEVKDAAAALLMGKSLSRAASAPMRPHLSPLATAVLRAPSDDGLRLPPITVRTGSSSRLPPIRDLLALRNPVSDGGALDSPTSPVAGTSNSGSGAGAFTFSSPSPSSSSATATASSSRAGSAPLYPSLTSIAPTPSSRPVSAGGVERLTHRVHKLRLPSSAGDVEHPPAPVLENEADLSASSDEEDDDHPSHSKKSRVDASFAAVKAEEELDDDNGAVDNDIVSSPAEEADTDADADADERRMNHAARAELETRTRVIAKRKAVIAYLAMYVNHKYREQLARKSMAQVRKALKKQPGPAAAASLGAAAHAIKEETEREADSVAAVEA